MESERSSNRVYFKAYQRLTLIRVYAKFIAELDIARVYPEE